jgi:hypothetical protein
VKSPSVPDETETLDQRNELPLFTTFLFTNTRGDRTMRFMLRIALFMQRYQDGFLIFRDHLERLPLWSDYLIIQLVGAGGPNNPLSGAVYCWASEKLDPDAPLPFRHSEVDRQSAISDVPLPGSKFQAFFGSRASVRIEVSDWV